MAVKILFMSVAVYLQYPSRTLTTDNTYSTLYESRQSFDVLTAMIKLTHMRLFPDHCEKNAMATMIRKRRRLPGVRMRLSQPTFAATSRSNRIAVLISSNSYSTSGSFLRSYPSEKARLEGLKGRSETLTCSRPHGSTLGSATPRPLYRRRYGK